MNPTITQSLIPASVPDWTPGRGGNASQYIILHTTDGTLEAANTVFDSGSRQSSAHRIIGLDGSITLKVSDGDTAWHAANWFVNQRSFGLEHVDNGNYNDPVRTDALYASSAWQVADWCRRYSIPCKKVAVDANHNPVESGIALHREVSTEGTNCPDGLDWQRIITQAQALLGGIAPAVVEASANPTIGITSWGPANVRITVDTLKVHKTPDTSDAGNFGNTPDGMLHLNDLAAVNGCVRAGAPYSMTTVDGDVTSDLYCHTTNGHFFAAAGSDFPEASGLTLLAATPTAPMYDFTIQTGSVVVIPTIGANIRSQPIVADNVVEAQPEGASIAVIGFVSNGGVVDGNAKWWKTPDSTYISDEVVSFVTPPAATPEPVAPEVAIPVTPSVPPIPTSTAPVSNSVGPAADITAPSSTIYSGSKPITPTPMTLRDYLVAFVAWVMKPFIK